MLPTRSSLGPNFDKEKIVWPCDLADKLGSHNTVDSVVGTVKMLSTSEINCSLSGQNNK